MASPSDLSTPSSSSSSSPPPHSKIYTKTGDTGSASLYNLQRKPKNSSEFEALGTIDELNSHLGLAREYALVDGNKLSPHLVELQSRLFDLGAAIATPLTTSSETALKRTSFPASFVASLESLIDEYDALLPRLTHFILPSGGLCSAQLHVCRTVCRRAERSVIELKERGDVEDVVVAYLNRMSDLFFVWARYAAMKSGHKETIWIKARKKEEEEEEGDEDKDEKKQKEETSGSSSTTTL